MGETEGWSQKPEEERPRCAILSQAAMGARRADALPANDRRGSSQVDAHLWHLPCMRGGLFSRLHEELGLLSGGLTPRVEELLVRLSVWMPYESAWELLEELLGVQVSKATARRATLHTGQAQLSVCEAEVERLKQEMPQAPAGVEKQAMSGDGAMVHLVGGEWAEVKTLAIGEVTRNQRGEVCTQDLSYCSRLCDAASECRKQRSAKRIGEGWNGHQRCARYKMARSGCLDWWITTVRMRYAFSTLRMPPSISTRSGRPCRKPEADYPRAGWRECCTGSSTRDRPGCSPTWPG